MKHCMVFLLVILMVIVLPVLAQDDDNPCTTALDAAQEAYDNEDFVTAQTEIATAVDECASDFLKYRDALALQSLIGARVEARDATVERDSAVPGMVDIGDYSLFMTCEGEGSPTVIFENGLGAPIAVWDDVYPAIAEVTQICRYDRLGVEWSDDVPDTEPRTAFTQAEDLHQVLTEAEIPSPYVLVGHSIAGIHLIAYTHLYPDDIVGVVLVDASHPEQMERGSEVDPNIPQFDILGTELLDWDQTLIEFEEEEAGNMGDIPVVVLTAMRGQSDELLPVWIELQEDHAARSTNSQHILLEDTGHGIPVEEPQAVIDAIIWVLDEVENTEEE
ncbi:MAG: alpha/beta hydrolase [Chloroflexi bacterium]|nr:alpha/beta hydrolase [Chloroflexota bacterium]